MAFLGKGLKPLFSTCKRIALLEYSMVSIHLTKNEFGFFSTINNLFKYFTCNNLPIGNELFLQAIKCVTTASFWKNTKKLKSFLSFIQNVHVRTCATVHRCKNHSKYYIHTYMFNGFIKQLLYLRWQKKLYTGKPNSTTECLILEAYSLVYKLLKVIKII